ncbi:TPA: hypothetical protein ACGBK0_004316, partial [Escherichia coli]
LTLVQHTKHPVTHPLNSLFNLIQFPAQFLYFVVIRKQDQATFRDLHGNASADLKSRFSQSFGADFDHRRVAAVGQITHGTAALCFGNDDFWRNIVFSHD